MNSILKQILNDLHNGSLDSAYQFKAYINKLAVQLYELSELKDSDVEDLGDIITIGNITYNDTDRLILPLEDGIYDLLLEKYKKYNPNFQVGADVLRFKSSSISETTDRSVRPLIEFYDVPTDLKFRDNILIDMVNYLNENDFRYKNEDISTSNIGKRYHTVAHEHPELIGTLDKCKFVIDRDALERGVLNDPNVKTVERDFFQPHLNRGLINPIDPFDIVMELKYDGVSVEADCTDVVVSARSRGDVLLEIASDFTPLLKGYRFPHRSPNAKMVGVKFEAIITQDDLPYFNMAKGHEYKNCRSAIVGLLASNDVWKYRDFITLVPLAVEESVYRTICGSDRVKEIEYLNREFVAKGCPLRYAITRGKYIDNLAMINIFTREAESLRSLVPFMYDGVVISYRDEQIRQVLGRENFINKFSIAIKFNPLRKQTIFRGYSYTVGQDGSITPMIHYDPVEFYGTIHTKSTGHSFARFKELKLHIGDIIDVDYVNDVMPYVSKPYNDFNMKNEQRTPMEQFPIICPNCGGELQLSSSGKSIKCLNPQCGGRQLSRMVNMFSKLNLIGFGEATIRQLDVYSLLGVILMITQSNWKDIAIRKGFGPIEAINLQNEILKLIKESLPEANLLGAIGFSGISIKTWELILSKIKYADLVRLLSQEKYLKDLLSEIKGIGPSIATVIVNELPYFKRDLDWMYSNANIVPYINIAKRRIVVSGFRDQELATHLANMGFEVSESLTKNAYLLLVPDTSFVSGKTKKATEYGIPIIPVQDFKTNMSKYL